MNYKLYVDNFIEKGKIQNLKEENQIKNKTKTLSFDFFCYIQNKITKVTFVSYLFGTEDLYKNAYLFIQKLKYNL